MRLFKTRSHTSERLGYEARKNAKKCNWRKRRRYNKSNHCRKPPAYRQRGGGARRKRRYDKTNHRQKRPAYRQRGGEGARRRKANWRRTQALRQRKPASKPSRRPPPWRGLRRKGENQHGNGKVAKPTVPRGGEALSWKRIAKRKQNNMHHEENKTKNTQSCATV